MSSMDVKVARTAEDLEGIREAWSNLQGPDVTSDPDHYLEILRHGPHVQRPHIVRLLRDGRDAGMVVARLETIRLVSKIGYRPVYRPRVRALRVAYGGLLGQAVADLAPQAITELMSALRSGEADVVVFPNLRTDGAAFASATRRPPFLLRQHVFDRKVHRRRHLPESFDAFLASLSRRTREGIRRHERRLLRAHGDELSVRSLDGPDDVDAFFGAARPVAAATYQGGLGVGVSGSELERALTMLAASRGWLRARVLYLGDRPIAFWHGFAYRGVFQTHVPGYLPEYRDLNVGTYLLLRLIDDLCADPSIDVLDFGFGEAEYKRRFGDEGWEEADVAVFAPTLTGLKLNAIRTALSAANRVGHRALGSGLMAKTKRAWRSRMSRRTT